MKATDDYQAKLRFWLENPRVMPWIKPEGLPEFRSRKFQTYVEFNVWKATLLAEVAARGGVTWKRSSSN